MARKPSKADLAVIRDQIYAIQGRISALDPEEKVGRYHIRFASAVTGEPIPPDSGAADHPAIPVVLVVAIPSGRYIGDDDGREIVSPHFGPIDLPDLVAAPIEIPTAGEIPAAAAEIPVEEPEAFGVVFPEGVVDSAP